MLLWPGHPFAGRPELRLSELADQDWIGVEGGLMVDDVSKSIATVTGVNPPIAQRINDSGWPRNWYGVAWASPCCLATWCSRDLVRRPIADIRLARRIEAVTLAGADGRPAIALVLEELRTIAAGVVDQRY
ncbi:LysR substrate-binding domain-containing protein [Mycobacterium sp. NPDC003323]